MPRVALPAVLLMALSTATTAADPFLLEPNGVISSLTGQVGSVAFSPDGAQLAAGLKNEVVLVDVSSRSIVQRLTPADGIKLGQVRAVTFAPNGQFLAVGGYQQLQLVDLKTGKFASLGGVHRGIVSAVAFSPDSQQLLSGADDETAAIWDVDKLALRQKLDDLKYPVNGVAWSAQGAKVIATGDINRPTKAGLVELRTGTPQTFEDHQRAALCAAFSADGHWLATGGLDEQVIIYNVETGKPLGSFKKHGRPVLAVQFLPQSDRLVSIGGGRAKGGNFLKVWQRETGEEVATSDELESRFTSLAVSPDGRWAATGLQDQTVAMWDLNSISSLAVVAAAVDAVKPEAKVAQPAVIRVGVIGLDTSHATAFLGMLNDPKAGEDVAGCKIVAAYPKGSPDIESSTKRVPEYVEIYKKAGIEIVDSIPALLEKVDCVLLETNDGRPHLEQLLPVLKAGKRCFIDKPIAGSLADAIAIFELSKHYKVPVWSSSSLRYVPGALEVRGGKIGDVLGCDAFSPCSLEATHPDLFWYGIHGVELLFTAMGTGCESVVRVHSDGIDVVTGLWQGGRVGTFRGIRTGAAGYGGRAFGTKGMQDLGTYSGYKPLLVEIVKYFKSGEVPVSDAETLEIYAFMEAADESKRRGGVPVKLADVMTNAREEAAAKVTKLLEE